ncbi:alpha/beta hydrolase [Pseudomonas sp. FW215-R2]|uniref:alpha/beta fold hydrolase n=2 Tax=Pseudomonas TaxID=286 RepID=UPI000C88D593|nr:MULTISPECIES: alpha/beta hydrolase [unclassified Pseudomonas]PMX00690.1 alpha/beta hydrolase [Pseudomonas sp. FW215-R2]PMX06569.1 alpha/beta hydrolase [Pseudomonas sp. FW215-L1]PMX22587.1 alpha/beta hydrolase [Pseudomonas sp. FW215-E1]PNA30420.1 alpha/beta hydrolase [Pseudomonas sp. FW215-R4]
MNKLFAGLALAAAMAGATSAMAAEKPTVVLVHGAFADSSSWNGVVKILEKDGYPVIAAANPLRTLKGDAQSVADVLAGIKSPVVLVGHSYGGPVISEAAYGNANVKALVYVAALAPEAGETVAGLAGKFPGSTLGPTLAPPVTLKDGGKDLYIQQDKFHDQFAADVPNADAKLMAATQRPVTEAALNEAASEPAWKMIPSWFVYGDKDKNIPPQAMAFMAERAHARQTVVVKGASHMVMVSNPKTVASLIESAATAK